MSPTITAITEQARRRGRLNIFIDGAYAFSLHESLAACLEVGRDLSAAEIAELKQQDLFESAYQAALRYIVLRPRSEKEMRQYFVRRGLGQEAIEGLLERLRAEGWVDDRAFAAFWVDNREAFRPKGRWALSAELREKGVDQEVIKAALEPLDEEESAQRAAEKALRRYASLDEETFRRRLSGYLQRRGFPAEVCRRIVERLWREVERERLSKADPLQGE
ncbi:MAG: RecX family transcriptional regulator [Chloroflexi bacterium]|nr:RecX family transcriptional regulator [Chloroflexota bacterium]